MRLQKMMFKNIMKSAIALLITCFAWLLFMFSGMDLGGVSRMADVDIGLKILFIFPSVLVGWGMSEIMFGGYKKPQTDK